MGALTFFLRGRLKGYAILIVTVLCSAALFAGILTGNAGGELVYKHKAASYLNPESGTRPAATKPRKPQE